MTVSIAPQYTQRAHNWTSWKAIHTAKCHSHQYADDGSVYIVWSYDGPEVHLCTIWKGEVPYGVLAGGYTQEQNDADKADFEANYQPTANQQIEQKAVDGKLIVVQYPAEASTRGTPVNIYADDPLELSNTNSPHDTNYTIPDGKTFYFQRAIIGAAKDPSEMGSKVELIYKAAAEHVLARYYVDQKTFDIQMPDRSTTRDGTSMVGDGSTKKIIIRRTRMSSSKQEVDVHVQGYLE